MNTLAIRLRAAENNPALSIGIAWNLLGEAAAEIDRLEYECFKLAAGVCEHRSGDDHGNPYCLKSKTNI